MMDILGKLLILLLIATGLYISFTTDREKACRRRSEDEWFPF